MLSANATAHASKLNSEMDRESLLAEAAEWVCASLSNDTSGHDWWHIFRVASLARKLAVLEGADEFICHLAALLHDMIDDKVVSDPARALDDVTGWMIAHEIAKPDCDHIVDIITHMSFSSFNGSPMATLEGRIVQDADRIDAIGAIGIARAFAYGGSHARLLFDPEQPPQQYANKAAYRASSSSTINHFHEKLLLLRDLMNTEHGKNIAEHRHKFMEAYLAEFSAEWAGES